LPEGASFQSIGVFSPIGQTFTPTLPSLNFVNLLTAEAAGTPFAVDVEIRDGSISGTILGTSLPVTVNPISPTTVVVTSFIFPSTVTLVPGDLYVMQVVEISGEGLVGSSNVNNYPGGTQILGGIPQPNDDLWFQEGISTPEPVMPILMITGLIALVVATRRPSRQSRRVRPELTVS
jgi:hypothetical protein